MSVWHGNLDKKKASSGRKRRYRKKRKSEIGSFPSETTLGATKKKVKLGRGGTVKIQLLHTMNANVSTPSTGKTEQVEIIRVVENPSNVNYDRRGVITKGSIIETSLGTARVASRPGQDGLVNAVLITE